MKQWMVLVLATIGATLMLGTSVALAQTAYNTVECDSGNCLGTNGSDHLGGTVGRDKIIAKAGDDLVHAGGGKDSVFGNGGLDYIYGGEGDDELRGGGGKTSSSWPRP